MKIKSYTNLIVNIVIIGFILLIIANWASLWLGTKFGSSQSGTITYPKYYNYRWEDKLKPIDDEVPDSLSYRKYATLTDSIKTMRKIKNIEFPADGGSEIGNLIGITGNTYCDNCSIKQFQDLVFTNHYKQHIRYYIKLLGWKINNSTWAVELDSVQFHVERGQYYVREAVIRPEEKIIRVIDVPVKFKYDNREQCLMIPVSKSASEVFNVVLLIFGIGFALYFFYLISAFLKFVLDLSKGLSFTLKNVRRLKLIALSLIILPFVVLLLDFLFKLIFYAYFTSDVVFNWDKWRDYWKIIAVGVIFLALYKAFRQGKKLKDEQELTI